VSGKQSGFEDMVEANKLCIHPEHNPPMHLCIPYGKQYRHVCPDCGKETVMKSPQITCEDMR